MDTNCIYCRENIKHQHSPQCMEQRNCWKEINPKHFPLVFWGEPFVFDENIGCCCDCKKERENERANNEGESNGGSDS